MKSPITWLPNLALVGLIAVFTVQTPVPQSMATLQEVRAEIQMLRQQLKVTSERLEQEEAETHHVVPRGL